MYCCKRSLFTCYFASAITVFTTVSFIASVMSVAPETSELPTMGSVCLAMPRTSMVPVQQHHAQASIDTPACICLPVSDIEPKTASRNGIMASSEFVGGIKGVWSSRREV
jgi:hypothetical protein